MISKYISLCVIIGLLWVFGSWTYMDDQYTKQALSSAFYFAPMCDVNNPKQLPTESDISNCVHKLDRISQHIKTDLESDLVLKVFGTLPIILIITCACFYLWRENGKTNERRQ